MFRIIKFYVFKGIFMVGSYFYVLGMFLERVVFYFVFDLKCVFW